MGISKFRSSGKRRLASLFLSLTLAATGVAAGGITASASPEMASAGVYVRQMGSGYCTLASAVDMMRSKMYLSGNPSWPNVTQQGAKSTAWGGGLYHQFTYYGMTVTYSTANCNTKSGLINLLNQHPEGVEIYIRDLPHAVLLTRYDASSGEFYVADPVYDGERTLMTSWQRKAGSTQDAVIRTIDAYWYISKYENKTVPGGLTGPVASNTGFYVDNSDFEPVRSTVQLPYICSYSNASFFDVDQAAWYAPYVRSAYEMAMMNGISAEEFYVSGNVTLAQTICMAARIHSIYYGDNYDFTAQNGEPWFMPYVRYAKANNMLASKYDNTINTSLNYDWEAYRIQFAEIMNNSLPPDQLTAINNVYYIADVPADSGEVQNEAVYDLYRAGVLNGDGTGFNPWRTITRAEVSAVVSRIGDASMRVES